MHHAGPAQQARLRWSSSHPATAAAAAMTSNAARFTQKPAGSGPGRLVANR